MAQVIWKDIAWTGEDRELGIKELLTILKGYGPMEVLHFEKPNHYKGKISLWLDEKAVLQDWDRRLGAADPRAHTDRR